MDNKKEFTKLSALADSEFEILEVKGYKWKKWDTDSKRMIAEDNWFEGASKKYLVDTDKGMLDLSESQLGMILAKVSHHGKADANGVTVQVKTNGKTGMEIRYYLNPSSAKAPKPTIAPKQDTVHEVPEQEPIDLADIPF